MPTSENDPGDKQATGATAGEANGAASSAKPRGGPQARRPQEFPAPKADPYPAYARMRAAGPVHHRNVPGLGPTTLIPRYADALAMLKDHRLVKNSSDPRLAGTVAAERYRNRGFGRDLVQTDPPDHTRLRRLIGTAFTSRSIEQLDARVERVSARLIERVRARGEIELVSEFATDLPIKIITGMLGVPIADPEKFRRFTYALTFAPVSSRPGEALAAAQTKFSRYLESLFIARRQEPKDDLLTALVQAQQDGDRLSEQELVAMVYLLLIGGFMTTANLIGNGIYSLLRHPDQLELLRRNPDLIESAVEELLRFESPLELSAASFASSDIELDGGVIRRGETVRIIFPSAHHDETKFKDPDRLDVTRHPCPHMAFGQGIHFCIGAPLARLEGKVALRMLIDRLPNVRLADPSLVQWIRHPALRGLERLPLRFDA